MSDVSATTLAMLVTNRPDTLATLDDPERIAPRFQIGVGGRIGWFEITDGLSHHRRFRTNSVGRTLPSRRPLIEISQNPDPLTERMRRPKA